ncbi:MAG: hypothetical protein IJL39_04945 [Clostridia bacterium]|nr:hypothetical protein [Clostridia bacterium]
MKLLYAIGIVCSFSGLGLMKVRRDAIELQGIEQLCRYMTEFFQLLKETREDLPDLTAKASVRVGLRSGAGVCNDILLETEEQLCEPLSGEALALTHRFFHALGVSSMPRQEEHCLSCIREGERLLHQRRSGLLERRRMTLSLSVLGGLFFAILLQ